MPNLHDLPIEERPRERLIKYGVEVLSLQELLALIFGKGTKGEPVMSISQKLLTRFGSLQGLSETSIEDLRTINGLGLAKACQLKACFELGRRFNLDNKGFESSLQKETTNKKIGPEIIYQAVRSKIINYHKEHFIVVSLDNRNKIIGVDVVSIGTLNSNLVHPRETFEVAIKRHAAQIVLCHNHPSGELTPSDDDISVTKNIIAAGRILGIQVIDHLIITRDGLYSFSKNHLL